MNIKKLSLNKETLVRLSENGLANVGGGARPVSDDLDHTCTVTVDPSICSCGSTVGRL